MKGLNKKPQAQGGSDIWINQAMAKDLEGSGRDVKDVEGEGDYVQEFQFGWNEDKVDLEFKKGLCEIRILLKFYFSI